MKEQEPETGGEIAVNVIVALSLVIILLIVRLGQMSDRVCRARAHNEDNVTLCRGTPNAVGVGFFGETECKCE